MPEILTKIRRRVLERLSDQPVLVAGTDLTAAAWLAKNGYAVRHRLNHFSATTAGSDLVRKGAPAP